MKRLPLIGLITGSVLLVAGKAGSVLAVLPVYNLAGKSCYGSSHCHESAASINTTLATARLESHIALGVACLGLVLVIGCGIWLFIDSRRPTQAVKK